MGTVKKRAAVVGYAQTKLGKFPERTVVEMMAGVAKEALEDAGLEKRDLDGLIVKRDLLRSDPIILNERVLDFLKIRPTYCAELESGGASFPIIIGHAAAAIASGMARVVLCVAAGKFSREVRGELSMAANMSWNYEAIYGPNVPAIFAMAARRYMHEFGATAEQFAKVSVAARKWALKNPLAAAYGKGELTVKEVLNARMIASPLTLLMCAFPGEAAAAAIVAATGVAKGLRNVPVYILGVGECHAYGLVSQAENLTTSGAKIAAERAYRMAGVTPRDVDVFTVYDAFASCVPVFLEDLGICGKGEGARFVDDGRIGPGGDVPVNPHGGFLSGGQASNSGGFLLGLEGIRQLMNRAGERQVKNAEVALCQCFGGMAASNSVVVFGR